jgi:hypothetical protein
MKRRDAITLVEVLVAIFIMAIGMMALLTLFPLGALRMAQAIQDDRCAQCAANADSIATIKNIRQDPGVIADLPTSPDLFKEPYAIYGVAPPDDYGPSNPILVDPAGYLYGGGEGNPMGKWVAGLAGGLRRRPTSFATSLTECYRWFFFLDDYEFDRGASLPGGLASPVTRDLRYSWAFLLQRPQTKEPSIVDEAVLVFKSRPLSANPREFVYAATFDTSTSVLSITYDPAAVEMPVRAGEWLLDATVTTKGGKRYAHAWFYRVASVTDIDTGTPATSRVDIEVQTPFRGFGAPGSYSGTVIYFDGLVEVFERRTGWRLLAAAPRRQGPLAGACG